MPVYRLNPFEPADPSWQKSVMDPETCWVVADSEDQARSKIATYAYGLRTPSTDAMQLEAMRWTALAICSVDETVTVPSGIILTKRGQRIPIPTTPSSENESA